MKQHWVGKYEYLDDFNLVLEHHSGDFMVKDLIPFRIKLLEDKRIPEDANFIIDIRESTPYFSYEQLLEYIEARPSFKIMNSTRKAAILTDTPAQVAFITLLKQNIEDDNGLIKIFSTPEEALKWLNSSIPAIALEELLDALNSPLHKSL